MSLQRYMKSLKKLWRRLQSRMFNGRSILVLGDSHCGVFEYCFDRGLLTPHWLNCEIVAGATAYGLNVDTSATQGWQKFDSALRRFADCDVVVIMLGECDCSFALWKKAEQLNLDPASLIDHSLAGIRRLVRRIRDESSSPGRKIVLAGAILPTVSDSAAWRQENQLRREITASQVERTQLVLAFNEKLKRLAGELDLAYFDLTAQTLDSATGLVDEHFAASAEDHHLSHPASALLWSASLVKTL